MRQFLLATVLVGAAAACATADETRRDGAGPPASESPPAASPEPTGADPRPSDPTSSEPPPSATTLPTPSRPTEPPKTPTDQRSPVTVAGLVQQGVEPGCVVLVASDTNVRYVLTGPMVEQIDLGSAVKVRGMPLPERTSPCQPGVVLRVQKILPV